MSAIFVLPKIETPVKIEIFVNIEFFVEIEIVGEKNEMLTHNWDFDQKLMFWLKRNRFFDWKSKFCSIPVKKFKISYYERDPES